MASIEVTVHGRLFTDGQAFLRQGLQDSIEELVQSGEQRLDQMLRPRPAGVYLSVAEAQRGKASTGNYRRNVHSIVTDLHGLITDGGVVYGPWLEGTSNRNMTTRFKGYASFRRTAQWIESLAPAVLKRNIERAIRRMDVP